MPQKVPLKDPKKQRYYYAGKRKRHTLKSQVGLDKKSRRIICISFCIGKRHDFRLYKESNTHLHPLIRIVTDSGYQGLQKLYANALMPKKRKKNQALTQEEKKQNRAISSQ